MRAVGLLILGFAIAAAVPFVPSACDCLAQDAAGAPAAADAMPMLRLEPGGPISFTSALAFNPRGDTLYAAGWDKVVRAWNWNAAARRFVLDPAATYRVPIGPGLEGAINAIAVSPDGVWLAAAGRGLVRGASDLRHPGWRVPTAGVMTAQMRQDQGEITLFDTRTHQVRSLRGHTAPVVALAFAPAAAGKPPMLISAGQEWDDKTQRFTAAVRAWDVARATYTGGVTLGEVVTRPGITAWHTGSGAKQLMVAIAWGDASESLRLWNLETGTLRAAADGQFNNTALWWSEGSRLITGSTGRLKFWSISSGAPTVAREVPLRRLEIPRAIALVSSTPRQQPDRLAVVIKRGDGNPGTRLRLLNLGSLQFVDSAEVELWDAAGILPSLAASGGRLAIAGNSDHEIATLNASELLAGQTRPALLGAEGFLARAVGFARRDDVLGLIISPQAKPGPGLSIARSGAGELVFDPAHRRVTGETSQWQLVRPKLDSWRIEPRAAEGGKPFAALTVRNADRVIRQIELPAGRQLTDFALLPALHPRMQPIVAVASHELGQPALELYDVASGQVVRELTGHVAAIESLAVSDDGKLLASAAADRTVCLWNVADLDRVLGARGTMPGIILTPKGNALVVAELAADSPYRNTLAPGDELVGWVGSGGKTEPVGSAVDFYLRVSRVKPGETMRLARRRAGGAADVVELTAAQGADERKPLFSLFITRSQPVRWIAWSPLGPYDASGDDAQSLLGWHFNTGNPLAPARFATADQYRHLRRQGLTAELMASGNLPQAESRQLDRPEINVQLRQPGVETQGAVGRQALRLSGREANLDVEVRGLVPRQVQSVTWRVAGGEPRVMDAVSRQLWSAPLDDLPPGTRDWQIEVEVKTAEAQEQAFAERVAIHYEPPAPTIEQITPAAEQSSASAADARLSAIVQSRESRAGAVRVRLAHLAAGREVLARDFTGKGQIKLDQVVKLEPGDNTITLTAANDDAADAKAQQTVIVRRFHYQRQPERAPQIVVHAVTADGSRFPLASDQAQPLVVDTPSLVLEGTIAAQKPLERAAIEVGGKATTPEGFVKNSSTQFKIKQSIMLVPGPQRIACLAQAAGGLPTEVSLSVDYRPQVGQLSLTAPQSGMQLIEGRDSRHVKLLGRIEPAVDPRPARASVLVNGQAVGDPQSIEATQKEFAAEIELVNGENAIAVELSNAWQARLTSEAVRLSYLRPPRVVELSAPAQTQKPLVDVSFTIESPPDLKLTGMRVNDFELPPDAATVERETSEGVVYRVVASNVPLREGANQLRPLARNAEGWSVLTKTAEVTLMLPPPPPAQIEFVSPASDRTVDTKDLEVRFTVHSASRLKRVELRGGARGVQAIDVSAQEEVAAPAGKDDAKQFVLHAAVPLELDPQDNHLQAVAVNDGGESRADLTVTFVRKPVEVVIDRLDPTAAGDLALVPQLLEGGRLQFSAAATQGHLYLSGRVRWPDEATQSLNPVSIVQVWINGFLQQPVALKAPRGGGLEWAWKAKIRLNRAGQNDVSVRLPDVARAADCRLDFQVACAKPDERQRLHLLVVGVGEKNTAQLEQLALRAVRGRRTSGDQIATPAFEKGWIYLISGYVNRARVNAQLERIHLRVGDPADAAADVVMVYFRGQESVDDAGQFYLLTSQSQFDPDVRSSAVSGRDLSDRFSSAPGAQLFLLDVQRRMQADATPGPESQSWPSEPQMAALRYAWLSNEAAPSDARLLVAVDNAVPRGGQLGEIEAEVARDSTRTRQKYGPVFRYEPKVPAALRYLVIAKIPGAN